MIITISKKEIFEEVNKRSSLEGYLVPELYEKIWADNSRGELLNSYWIEGYTAAVQLLKRYLNGDTVEYSINTYDDDEILRISASLPERYESLLDGSIVTDVKMMIACNILHGWMEVVYPSSAPKYDEESKGYAEDLRVKLLYRKSPSSKFSQAKNDSVNIEDAEYPLVNGRSDMVEISNTESALSVAKSDMEAIGGEESALSVAKRDNVILEQYWGRCKEGIKSPLCVMFAGCK